METERLIIDRMREDDRHDYFLNIPHDRRVLATFMARYNENEEELDISPYVKLDTMFAIRLKETSRLIGVILYFDVKEDSCEIGYAIGYRYWNHGYVSEAVTCFLKYLFEEKNFSKVCASFFTGNIGSQRVMEKCGMQYDHYSPGELEYLGIRRDLIYYSITREQWQASQKPAMN